jgi:DNA modification methylase
MRDAEAGARSGNEPSRVITRGTVGSQFWELHEGDAREVLARMAPESVDCVITSPPYYWQRDYDVEDQIGLEPTITGYVDNIRSVFRGLWQVLKKDGTVFLNLGDTYYSAKGLPHGDDAKHRARRFGLRAVDGPGLGLPRKSLIGIPWRVALALQQDGWTLRSSIIWHRRTSTPEPTARDRPWRTYEFVFLLTRSPRYYFDRGALGADEDVWLIEPERNSISRGTHYAPYPRELVRRCIDVGCREGGVVLDPFVGGGTTMSVGLDMRRSVVGIELNPSFCGLIRKALVQRSADPEHLKQAI